VVVVVLVDATGRLVGCGGASAAIAGTSPRMAAAPAIRAAVSALMVFLPFGYDHTSQGGKLVWGSQLVTPAEAEDLPSKSLVDTSL
jgi:hypothetical protein